MKIVFASLIFLMIPLTNYAQILSNNAIREQLSKAATDEDIAHQLVKELKKHQHHSATLTALQATATGILCLHTNNPVKQIKYSKEALVFADKAVAMDTTNLDARFARFAIQSNIPKLLGMSPNVEEDRAFFATHFSKRNFKEIPFASLEAMIHLFEESNEFSTKEILQMKQELYSD